MTIAIRAAGADHVAAIDALLRSCFPRGEEADLVRNLCVAADMVLVLAALDENDGTVVGMVAFSRMAVDIGGRSIPAVALAPIAVASTHRHQGVAEALVHAGIEQLEASGIVLCFVLGDPDYYTRFGFAADVASGFSSPYAGEYLMALPLQGGLIPCGVRGNASHAAAFAMLSAE